MSSNLFLGILIAYFLILFIIAHKTSRGSTTYTFFTANKKSPWFVVAFGMLGTSLSGVTFISVPGWVGTNFFAYFQMVLGYFFGYLIISKVLLPLYYKHNLISIYGYLERRFGFWSYKTGAFYFLISRTIGAAFRLFLVATVLQVFIFKDLNISFFITVLITIALIWLYTFRGGIKTVVWTDTLQTAFMLLALIFTIYAIASRLDWSWSETVFQVADSQYAQIFFWDDSGNNFFKMFFSGAFITIVMTGLDQDMMQKNLTCATLRDAQKNMFWFSILLIIVNLLFLSLGVLLYIYNESLGLALPSGGDALYPLLAKDHLGIFVAVIFLLGTIAAAYSSADSALTALTTSFCIDFLEFDKIKTGNSLQRMRRIQVHLGFSVLIFMVVMIFYLINDTSVIDAIFKMAGYTYGPLLGLFAFGLFTKWTVRDKFMPFICGIPPVLAYVLAFLLEKYDIYTFGYEILILNGLITFLLILAIVRPKKIGVV